MKLEKKIECVQQPDDEVDYNLNHRFYDVRLKPTVIDDYQIRSSITINNTTNENIFENYSL